MADDELSNAEVLIASLTATRTPGGDGEIAEVLRLLQAAFSEFLGEHDFYCLVARAADRLGVLAPGCKIKSGADEVRHHFFDIMQAIQLQSHRGAHHVLIQLTQAVLDQVSTHIGAGLTSLRLRSALSAMERDTHEPP